MYPYPIIFGMGLYELFLTAGMLIVLFCADKMGIKRGFSVKLQKLVIINAVLSIVIGIGGAVVFQAFYNFMATGIFKIDQSTGMTFYGGLIFGVATFLLVWFFGGKAIGVGEEVKVRFKDIADIAACLIPLAHGLGRLGCLCAGCCHGGETDAWYGVNMLVQRYYNSAGELVEVWKKFVPTQLFEAIFLFALSAVIFWLYFKRKDEKRIPLLPVYAILYGIWRFCFEFVRGDDRGATIIPFLSPSQLVAVVMIALGTAYFLLWYFKVKKAQTADVARESIDNIEQENNN